MTFPHHHIPRCVCLYSLLQQSRCCVLAQTSTQAVGLELQKPWTNPFSFPSDEVQEMIKELHLLSSRKFCVWSSSYPKRQGAGHASSQFASQHAREGTNFASHTGQQLLQLQLVQQDLGRIFFLLGALWPHQLICYISPLDEVAPPSLCWIPVLGCPQGLWDVKLYQSHCTSRRTLLSIQFQYLIWEVQNTEPTNLNTLLSTVPISLTVLRHSSAPDMCQCPIPSFRKSTHLISFLNLEIFMFGTILFQKIPIFCFEILQIHTGSSSFYPNTYINLK